MPAKIKVMLSTEGTYPFHQGGVSTWCDIMVNKLPEYNFVVYSIIMNPYVTQKFTLPPNTELIKVPLWGTEEPSEHLSIPFSQVFLSKKRTTDQVIEAQFLPMFRILVEEFIGKKKNPVRLGKVLLQMHLFFETYEYKAAFKSKIVWEEFKRQMIEVTHDVNSGFDEPNIFALTQSLGWVYRFLNVINTEIPEVDVTHSAAAAFCGIPCVLAKLKYGTPFILTEHGVYLREQYFSLSQRGYISYMNTFLIRMIQSIADLNYYYADQVSPVCEYNTRWEKAFGVLQKNIDVIYNGVDQAVFSPGIFERTDNSPTVVTVARVDPLKDIKTLIEAAVLVREKIPNVQFRVYGAISVQAYYEECMALIKTYELEEHFKFMGHVKDIPSAYRSGDVIALSSISEAFPYSIVEAMLVGKPVVATDVGGVKEAVGETGIIVDPRSPEQLSQGLLKLLSDNGLRAELSREARDRALNMFTLDRVLNNYRDAYKRLAAGIQIFKQSELATMRVQLEMDKVRALIEMGEYRSATISLKRAIKISTELRHTILMIFQLVELLERLGDVSEQQLYLEKLLILQELSGEKVG